MGSGVAEIDGAVEGRHGVLGERHPAQGLPRLAPEAVADSGLVLQDTVGVAHGLKSGHPGALGKGSGPAKKRPEPRRDTNERQGPGRHRHRRRIGFGRRHGIGAGGGRRQGRDLRPAGRARREEGQGAGRPLRQDQRLRRRQHRSLGQDRGREAGRAAGRGELRRHRPRGTHHLQVRSARPRDVLPGDPGQPDRHLQRHPSRRAGR